MKRYYLARLKPIQALIKGLIINILITLLFILIMLFRSSKDITLYIYILIIVCLGVFLRVYYVSRRKVSFYFEEKAIIYCSRNKEINIEMNKVELIEEFYGIDYLFGKKTIILHTKEKKYSFMFEKKKANQFKKQIEKAINEDIDLKELDL